ncbi:MAG: extracellular solute-binding protein [Limnochordia bacterium]|nr:extracellular solute-binding protein [Limnochordia bacterium]NLL48700.1 extracellular solute-binding protein [Bacillota bacterium]
MGQKRFSLMIALVVLVILAQIGVVSAQKVTLTYWHGYNPVETRHFEETIIPLFEAKHPNVTVEAVAVPYDQFYQKIIVSIAGGMVPDLIRADLAWVPQLANLGVLVPLSKEMVDFEVYKNKVFPGTLEPNFWAGEYYGLPLDTNTRVLFWNKELFSAADLSGPPATFGEFLQYAEILAELEGVWGYAEGGTGGWNVLPLMWSNGGQLTDDEITRATGYLNSPSNVELLELLVEMLERGSLGPSILGDGFSTADGYAQGRYGMIIDGPWMVSIFADQYDDFEAQMALLPSGDGGSVSVVGGQDIVVFEGSKNKEAAFDFIRFMLQDEIQLSMAEVGQMPVIQHLEESSYIQEHPFYGIFFEQMKTARARTPHPEWPEIDRVLGNAVTRVLMKELTAQEALDEAAQEIDVLLQ